MTYSNEKRSLTDQRMDRGMDKAGCRVACTQLKNSKNIINDHVGTDKEIIMVGKRNFTLRRRPKNKASNHNDIVSWWNSGKKKVSNHNDIVIWWNSGKRRRSATTMIWYFDEIQAKEEGQQPQWYLNLIIFSQKRLATTMTSWIDDI